MTVATRYTPIVRAGLSAVIGGYALTWADPAWFSGGPRRIPRDVVRVSPSVTCCRNHEPTVVLGSVADGNFRAWVDNHGLVVELAPRDDRLGRDTLGRLEGAGIYRPFSSYGPPLRGWSVGYKFQAKAARITDVLVYEISLAERPVRSTMLTLSWRPL